MSCACPTSSCTFAVGASFRCRVGARRIHSRSGRTPMSSEFPCISMNLMSALRYCSHIEGKEDLLYKTMREGAAAFHAGLDAIPEQLQATEKIRLALRAHLRVVADQLDVATVFVQEWKYLEGARREEIVAERRRYEERIRALFREGRELGELRSDLDDATAALLVLSAANWAYTWLQPGRDTDELADRF